MYYFINSRYTDRQTDEIIQQLIHKTDSYIFQAIQEFTLLCKDKDNDVIRNILSFWPRIYNKLATVSSISIHRHHFDVSIFFILFFMHTVLCLTNWIKLSTLSFVLIYIYIPVIWKFYLNVYAPHIGFILLFMCIEIERLFVLLVEYILYH